MQEMLREMQGVQGRLESLAASPGGQPADSVLEELPGCLDKIASLMKQVDDLDRAAAGLGETEQPGAAERNIIGELLEEIASAHRYNLALAAKVRDRLAGELKKLQEARQVRAYVKGRVAGGVFVDRQR